MGASQNYNVNLNINANAQSAEKQLQNLQRQLQQISNMKVDVGVGNLTADIEQASQAAMKLSAYLATATNPQTGNLDFTKFYSSIQKSGASLEQYGAALQKMGPAGQKAFVSLADSISKSEIPLRRTSQMVDKMWDGLKRTAGWQIQSSIIHGIVGGVQQAVGYAKDLNKSLTDIRIVTGQSTDQMAKFAREANKAAKNLSTTTTDYTKASLIYYQQGLSDAEVKARTETTIKMANATGTSAQKVSDQMTAIWNNYDNGTKSLTHYADVMTALGAATASSTDEIAQGLQKFAAISNTVGLSYEYAASALATITAESRESADVVGNALKTLFSRIQGLQLGETLDDGTTLNKYSNALAKVGISIKDQTGGLKDMDDILNEMGDKWDTLARDEKMALAQTVAGVRQYTQLMTLMENWDDFKKNLNTATNSEGTLDQQAAIYAQSWEAASQRVRASWEGLWDTMVNSKGFITMLDGISGLVGFVDKLAASMGGAAGVLTSFFGIAMKIFSPKISQGLRDTAYNVSMLFGGEEKMKNSRSKFLAKANTQISVEGELGALYGTHESLARQAAMSGRIQAAQQYADNYDHMTDLQRMVESEYATAVANADERVIEAAHSLDERKNARYDARMNASFFDDDDTTRNFLDMTNGEAQVAAADQAINAFLAQYQDTSLGMEDVQANADYARLEAARDRANKVFEDQSILSEPTVGQKLGSFAKSLQSLYDVVNNPDTKDGTKNITQLKNALNGLATSGYDDKKTQERIKGLTNALDAGEHINFDGLYDELMTYQSQAAAGGSSPLSSTFNSWLAEEFAVLTGESNLSAEERRRKNLGAGRAANLQQQNVDWADTMTSAGEGLMLALSAGQSLKTLFSGDLDAVSNLMSLASAITSLSMAAASIMKVVKAAGAVGSKANWIVAIITAVLSALPAITEFIDDIWVTDKERKEQRVQTKADLENAVTKAADKNKKLLSDITAYEEASEALKDLQRGTKEWSESLYEANKIATDLIKENNLVEGEDYYRNAMGLIEINDKTLKEIEEKSEKDVKRAEAINDLAKTNIQIDDDADKYQEKMHDVGYDVYDAIIEKNQQYGTLQYEFERLGGQAGILSPEEYEAKLAELDARQQELYESYGQEKDSYDLQDDYEKAETLLEEMVQALQLDKTAFKSLDDVKNKFGLTNPEDLALAEALYSQVSNLQLIADEQNAKSAQALSRYDSLSRNLLADETYKNENEVFDSSGLVLRNYAEQNRTSAEETYNSQWSTIAKNYADLIGLSSGDENFKILRKTASGDVHYQYTDSENNIKTDGVLYKSTLIEYEAANQSLDELVTSTKTLDGIFTQLHSTTQTADDALSAYVRTQNTSQSTLKSMTELKKVLDAATSLEEQQKAIVDATGLSAEQQSQIATMQGFESVQAWIDGLMGSLKSSIVDIEPWQAKVNTRLGSKAEGLSDFVNGLNLDNLKLLDKTLLNAEAIAGESGKNEYIDSLVELVESVEDVDSNDLLQMLLNLDDAGSAAGNLDQIQFIIEGLGGSFDGASSSAAAFAQALNSISAPNLDTLLSKITQIKNVLGDIYSLDTGSNISKDIYDQIIKAFPELEKFFAEDIINGGYTFTGTKETARTTAKEGYFSAGDDIYQMQGWAKNTVGTWNTTEGDPLSMQKWGENIQSQFDRDMIEATQAGSQGENIAIEAGLGMFNRLAEGSLGSGALAAVYNQIDGINQASDITAQLDKYTQSMSTMTSLMDKVTGDNNKDGVTDYRDLSAEDQETYLNAQNEALLAQSILSNIWSIIEQLADPEGLEKAATDFEENKGQTATSVGELANMYNMGASSKDRDYLTDPSLTRMGYDTDMQNYAKNLALMAENYPFAAEGAAKLSEAIANENWALAESLVLQTELNTAIAQVAEARGMDAEQIAIQAEAINSNFTAAVTDADEATEDLQLSGKLTAEQVADMAAEMIAASNAANTLKSKSKDLYKDIKGKDAGKASAALKELEGEVKALIGVEGDAAKGGASFRKYIQENQDVVEKAVNGDLGALTALRQEYLTASVEEGGLLNDVAAAAEQLGKGDQMEGIKSGIKGIGEAINTLNAEGLWNVGEGITAGMSTAGDAIHGVIGSLLQLGPAGQAAASALGDAMGFDVQYISASAASLSEQGYQGVIGVAGEGGAVDFYPGNTAEAHADASGNVLIPTIVPKSGGGGGAGGGGGGGGEPKKVANKRKSQTVNRYKQNDFKRNKAQSYKKSAEKSKDYLYGESKIAQMEKINKLAEKEAHITSDRIKESQKYLKEDRENLIKVMQKWGYDATFDEDGFLTSYEEAWTKVHEKIAKLYEDNELTKDEQKLEEDYKVELEELEGALEDYENSLKELQADIEAYEESLYEMYDNKVEQMQHKVEFRIELNEDDLSYLDFWIEALGDSLYNALESLQTMGQKTNILFDGIETYKQGIEDIYALSDDPLHTWATVGLDEVLTQDQVDALRENRDGLMDYMKQLLELRSTIQDQVLETFDKWQEKLNTTMSTIEHYSSVLEHFKNIIDIVGKDTLGLTDGFMSQLQQSAVDQSMDSIEASRAHYESLVSQNATAQAELEAARARGDEKSAEHWEEVVKQTTSEMQSAQDQLLSSLESTLQMIAEQFESAMTRAVDAFNDAIYANGGLQGLQDDYSFMREQADLMAEDYDKIYQLSKLNRNINKLMNDSSIIAGKQKMKSLQQEINELQASGVELSKYDLDYLQAKYDLRVAELELENAKNNKDTVRLSRDSEGNWSYIYTASVDKVDEAQQKYEDALYAMQNLSYEYMDEMSNAMMQTSLSMMEEIQALKIQDFDSYDAYAAEVERIQNKYAEVLQNQENELNKSMANNADLYNQDWLAYSQATGYKISANEDWADNYYETTMGMLLGSSDATSGFSDLVGGLTNTLVGDLGTAAINYFANVETAMNKYGSSIAGFGTQVTSTVSNISAQSKTAAEDMKKMAEDMNKSFQDITSYVSNWQQEFGTQIDEMLTEISTLIQSINDAIRTSAELSGGSGGAGDLIGTKDAIKLLNENGTLGTFEEGENGQIIVNGETYSTWLDYNGQLIDAIDKKLEEYSQAELGSDDRAQRGEELKELFAQYQAFKAIVARIYDPTLKGTLDLGNANYSSFDTGGYTGEWGDSGKFAILHEKELILNQDDTKNFLDALNISKDVINSMIEMSARQSSMGFGDLAPATLKDVIQSLEQQVSIVAEFPNASDHNEIEEAFNNLINQASQYANRYKP